MGADVRVHPQGLAVAVLAGSPRLDSAAKINLGLAFEVVSCYGIALSQYLTMPLELSSTPIVLMRAVAVVGGGVDAGLHRRRARAPGPRPRRDAGVGDGSGRGHQLRAVQQRAGAFDAAGLDVPAPRVPVLDLRRARLLRGQDRVRHRHRRVARAGAGELPARRASGRGRHGGGVARHAPAAGAARGDQVHPAGRVRRLLAGGLADDPQAVRAGGAVDGVAQLGAHHRSLRLRRHRGRHVLLRHGAAGRSGLRAPGSPLRPAAAGTGDPPAAPGGGVAWRRRTTRGSSTAT